MKRDRSVRDPVFLGYLLLLVLFPLPHGSYPNWAWSFFGVCACFLLLAWLIRDFRKPRTLSPAFVAATPVLGLWGLWLGWLALQLVSLPAASVGLLSPTAHEIHSLVSPGQMTLSLDWYTSFLYLLKSCVYAVLFILTLLLLTSRHHVTWLLLALVLSASIQGLLALVPIRPLSDSGTGTFVSEAHLASYVTLAIALAIGVMLGQTGDREALQWRFRFRDLVDGILNPRWLLRIVILLLIAFLIGLGARISAIAMFSGLATTGAIYLLLSRSQSPITGITLIAFLIGNFLVLAALLGVERHLLIQQGAMAFEGAQTYWKDFWLTGSGGGTSPVISQVYQLRADAPLHAEMNVPGFALETGLVGMLLLASMVMLTLLQAISAIRQRRNQRFRGLAFGVLLALIIMVIQTGTHHHLPVPATAATMVVVLALGWVACFLPTRRSRKETADHPLGHGSRVAGMSLALVAGVFCVNTTMAAWQFESLNEQLVSLEPVSEDHKLIQTGARSRIGQIRALAPFDADVLARESSIEVSGLQFAEPAAERDQAVQRGLATMRLALAERPAAGQLWTQLMIQKHIVGEYDQEFSEALTAAHRLAPRHPRVQYLISTVGMNTWPLMSDRNRLTIVSAVDGLLLDQPDRGEAFLLNHPYRSMMCVDIVASDFTAVKDFC